MEGRPGQIGRNTWVQPSLEPIPETRESVTEVVSLNNEVTNNNGTDCAKEIEPIIPALEGNDAEELWNKIREDKEERESFSEKEAPLSLIGSSYKGTNIEELVRSMTEIEFEDAKSEANTLATLPSFQGEYEAKIEIIPIPSSQQLIPPILDMANLRAVLSAPVTATLPLSDFLKVKPEMWDSVANMLQKRGINITKRDIDNKSLKGSESVSLQLPVCKVTNYEQPSRDKGNTTLPVEFQGTKTMAILDTGAGVSIATKAIWEKWGKRALRKTRMTLQLADKNLELPLGLLEHVIVKSCGIEYEHTFAVVDFGQDPSYEVILGRPFMRQLMVIQDWGYNYLYLRHDDVITRVNLQDHSYRDVTKSPIEEFESGSSYLNPSKETDLTSEIGAWICQVHSQNLLDEEKILTDKAVVDEVYIPQPFPEDEIDPHLWIQVLATLDTSALEPGTQFCDEQGYDVIPIRMVTPIYLEEQGDDIQAEFLLRIQQEVSICDQAST